MYTQGSLKLDIKDKDNPNIKYIASNLCMEIKNSNVKFSIDTLTLLYDFLVECGVEISEDGTRCK